MCEVPDGKGNAPHKKNHKIASIGVCSFGATVALNCSFSVDQGDSFRYKGNGLLRYYKKEYVYSTGELKRPTTSW